MPRVSVVVPFHNRINWLSEAIQSVLDQTYNDFELLLIDDGSDEGLSPQMIADSRIRYVRQSKKGASAARNSGIDVATGEYVAFLDSDDLFVPTKLEKQVAYMEAHPEVLLTHTSYQRMTATGEDLEIMHSGKFSGRINRHLVFNCAIATPTVMVRRSALGGRARFEESLMVGEDIVLWLTLAIRSKIVWIDDPLTRVRMHGQNAALDEAAQLSSQTGIIKFVIDENPELRSALSRWSLASLYLDVAHFYLQRNDRKNFYEYLKRALVTWPLNPLALYAVCRVAAYKLLCEIRKLKNSQG